ncbi:hypothetical protein [Planococcus shenhongbingii]|uniref:DUF2007 domain-containing protein n=1 Tax=Planococcus shenhongbingii TaxID=3058398 RepID=A0ABT8NEP1_9BACL|nr:hypothetical protein [Planococcus sp. N017]MDN7246233.1 hypothetical protein [Planococcus sp. N017]
MRMFFVFHLDGGMSNSFMSRFILNVKLSEHGISYDVVRKSNIDGLNAFFGGAERGAMPLVRSSEINNLQYDFYVKKEDEHLAREALH